MEDRKVHSRLSEEVRKRIKVLRDERGLTQAELCELAGISIDAVTRIERGSRIPTLDTLEKLASALQVGVVDLLKQAQVQRTSTAPAVRRIIAQLQQQPPAVQERAAEMVQTFLKAVTEGREGSRRRR